MSNTSEMKDGAGSEQSAGRAGDQSADLGPRKRRAWRVVLWSLGSFLAVSVAASIGIYAYVNHTVSSIPRVHVGNLSGSGSGETFLIAGSPWEPGGKPVQGVSPTYTKLFLLLHVNA